MPASPVEFWWQLLIGTAVALTLVLTLILAVIYNQRVRLRLQAEKLSVVEGSERRYSELFNSVPDIIYVHSLDGTIIQVNRAVEQLLGLEAAEVVGRPIAQFLIPRSRKDLAVYLSRLKLGGGSLTGVIPIVVPRDGTLYMFEYRSSVVAGDENRTVVRGIARNITERLAYERALQKAERNTNRLLVEARHMQERLSQLSQEVIRTQEEDRRRISRELHDEIGQLLAAITVNLQILHKNPLREPVFTRQKLDEANGLVEQVYDRLHHFLSELRPAALDELGLLPALRRLVDQFSERTGIKVSFHEHRLAESLDGEQKIVVYRVIQESLTNAARHAAATCIAIRLAWDRGTLLMEIHDNGHGFEFSAADALGSDSRKHLGILGMQERVKLARGDFFLTSKRGEGTIIRVKMPVTGNGESR